MKIFSEGLIDIIDPFIHADYISAAPETPMTNDPIMAIIIIIIIAIWMGYIGYLISTIMRKNHARN